MSEQVLVLTEETGDGTMWYQVDKEKLKEAIIDPIDLGVALETPNSISFTYVTKSEMADALYSGMVMHGHSEEEAKEVKEAYLSK